MTVIIIIYNIFPPAEKKSHKFTKKREKIGFRHNDFVFVCVWGIKKK